MIFSPVMTTALLMASVLRTEKAPYQLPGLLHRATKDLYIQTAPDKVRGVSYTLFQRIQTPQDIATAEFQEDDVPYAGLLALQTQLFSWDKRIRMSRINCLSLLDLLARQP